MLYIPWEKKAKCVCLCMCVYNTIFQNFNTKSNLIYHHTDQAFNSIDEEAAAKFFSLEIIQDIILFIFTSDKTKNGS